MAQRWVTIMERDAEAEAGTWQTASVCTPGTGDLAPSTPNPVRIPATMTSHWGDRAEMVSTISQGRTLRLTQQGVSALMQGQRVAFFEVFCGSMHLTLGVRSMGLYAPDGVDRLYPVGGVPWDLSQDGDQEKCRALLDALNPCVTHFAPPCTEQSTLGSKPPSRIRCL